MDLASFPAYLLKGDCSLSPWLHQKVKFSLIFLIASRISHEHLVEVCGEVLESGCRFSLFLGFPEILYPQGSPHSAFSKFCLTFSYLLLCYLMSAIHALPKWASVQAPSLFTSCYISLYLKLLDWLVILMYLRKVMIF